MDLPKELTLIKEDLDGEYGNNLDCPLARALKRAGVPVDNKGYRVSGCGEIVVGIPGKHVGEYLWEDGTRFCKVTLRTGFDLNTLRTGRRRLVLK